MTSSNLFRCSCGESFSDHQALVGHAQRTLHMHIMLGSPGSRCSCGVSFDDYHGLAEHVRLSIACPHCGSSAVVLQGDAAVDRWICGHWIARGDLSATIRAADEVLKHYPTYGPTSDTIACACGYTERVDKTLGDAIQRVNMHVQASVAETP